MQGGNILYTPGGRAGYWGGFLGGGHCGRGPGPAGASSHALVSPMSGMPRVALGESGSGALVSGTWFQGLSVTHSWTFYVLAQLLADPGEARGCSTNTFVIN